MNSTELFTEMKKNINEAINKQLTVDNIKTAMNEVLFENTKMTYKKTEEILYAYPDLIYTWETRCELFGEEDEVNKMLKKNIDYINECLDSISTNEYYELIDFLYFQDKTIQFVCSYFDVTDKTISKKRRYLVNLLRVKFFTLEYLKELVFN